MKAHYSLPSGTYNIILDKRDLIKLLNDGGVNAFTHKIECTTNRFVYNSSIHEFEELDHKQVLNDMRFCIDEPVADIEAGDHFIQFINIILDETCDVKKEEQ